MDRGAWWATVRGVAKRWTQLSDSHISYLAASGKPAKPHSKQTKHSMPSKVSQNLLSSGRSKSQRRGKRFNSGLSFPSAELGITLKTSHVFSLERH